MGRPGKRTAAVERCPTECHATTVAQTTHAAHKHHSKKSQALSLIHPTANPDEHN